MNQLLRISRTLDKIVAFFGKLGGWDENFMARKAFPIVVDLQDMMDGFKTLERLASHPRLIVPGHDPLVREIFPVGAAPHIHRLDPGPKRDVKL